MTTTEHSRLRGCALISLMAGAVGSIAFTLYAGRRNNSRLLMVIMTIWVLSPFMILFGAGLLSKYWRPAARKLLYIGKIGLPLISLAVYAVDVKTHSSPAAIRAGLVKQLHTPVYWAATVRTMIVAGATRLIECGPGKVLTGLNRRVDKNRDLKMMALEDPASFEDALASGKIS